MRRYDDAISLLVRSLEKDASRTDRMRALTRVFWECFGSRDPADSSELARGRGVSWCGFYQGVHDAGGCPREMVLVCREPKPACSPIGLHGMCGKSWLERRPIVVRDVAVLGDCYVACDPRDRSELVVPVRAAGDGDKTEQSLGCEGVFDVDSYHLGAFSPEDVQGVRAMLAAAGLGGGAESEPILL